MNFPQPIPEVPVESVDSAITYYVKALGFTLDWGDEDGGIAGISKGHCRLFLTNDSFRGQRANSQTVVVWINLESRNEVDALFAEWKALNAIVIEEPEDKPWSLREFVVSDSDGNFLRVYYDFSRD